VRHEVFNSGLQAPQDILILASSRVDKRLNERPEAELNPFEMIGGWAVAYHLSLMVRGQQSKPSPFADLQIFPFLWLNCRFTPTRSIYFGRNEGTPSTYAITKVKTSASAMRTSALGAARDSLEMAPVAFSDGAIMAKFWDLSIAPAAEWLPHSMRLTA
jgi:hypothetical protein